MKSFEDVMTPNKLSRFAQRKTLLERKEPTLNEIRENELRLAFVSRSLYLYTKIDGALYRVAFTKV